MALAFSIKKAAYDKLSDDMKAEYMAGATDDVFVLDVTGLPAGEDTGPVKRSLENERNAHKATKAKLDEASATISGFPDVEALKTTHAAEVKKYKDFTETSLIDGTAMALAAKISTSPAVLLPHIKSRLVTDLTGDKPVTKVLGADGKVSDLTVDKLGEEFIANKDFGSIIIGSRASGGGAPRNPIKTLSGGALQGEQDGKAPDVAKMDGKSLAARISARKEAAAAQGATT